MGLGEDRLQARELGNFGTNRERCAATGFTSCG
jgi:hypothetical protein